MCLFVPCGRFTEEEDEAYWNRRCVFAVIWIRNDSHVDGGEMWEIIFARELINTDVIFRFSQQRPLIAFHIHGVYEEPTLVHQLCSWRFMGCRRECYPILQLSTTMTQFRDEHCHFHCKSRLAGPSCKFCTGCGGRAGIASHSSIQIYSPIEISPLFTSTRGHCRSSSSGRRGVAS